ncbi:MAG: restriction endonuclease subunit S [Candidatus Saccharibacteria bacterium]|nr:restriction endonuclease subunit S [Moraxellaceae bacterium]
MGRLVPKDNKWKTSTLGDIGFWAIGSGFPLLEQGSLTGNILFAKVSDMNNLGNEKFILETNNTITEETAKRLRVNVHPSGTVIFPKIGGAIATNKRRILVKPTVIDNNCLGITPNVGVSTEWIYLLLCGIDLSKYQAGTSVPALAQSVLQRIPVMLPEETEQHRIVAKVDELMALCDQLENQHTDAIAAHEKLVSYLLDTLTKSQDAADFNESWQRIAANFEMLFTTESSIDALKQTLLQLAVMGKLVPQDASDEPASELLKRIHVEKAKLVAEGKVKKSKQLAEICDDEKPFDLPIGWEWIRVSEVAKLITSGSRDWAQYLSDKGAKFITMGNLSRGSYELRLDNMRFVNPPNTGEGSRTKLEPFDLLISITGDVGNLGRIPENFGDAYINQHTCLLRFFTQCQNRYFPEILRSPMAKVQFNEPQRGVKNSFRLGDLENMVIPLPPLTAQVRIVAKIDELMTLCDTLKSRITAANQLQQKIADVMVEQAVA